MGVEGKHTDDLTATTALNLVVVVFFKPHSHPNGFYWGHQCSWTLTPANSLQVTIMQSDMTTATGSNQVQGKVYTYLIYWLFKWSLFILGKYLVCTLSSGTGQRHETSSFSTPRGSFVW